MPTYRKLYVKTVESLDLNDMPDDFARLLWVLLPLALCREGRGLHSAVWLRSRLFPLREDVTLEMISAAFAWFVGRGMVEVYSVEGRAYFHVPTFHHYQGSTIREAESNYPPPPGCAGATPEPVATSSCADADAEVEADADAEVEADADAGAATVAAPSPPGPPAPAKRSVGREKAACGRSPPLTEGQRAFLELFGARRFRTQAQYDGLLQLEREHGTARLLEAARWASEKGMSMGEALGAMRTALPAWRDTKPGKPRAQARPEPKGYSAIRDLAQEEGWEGFD